MANNLPTEKKILAISMLCENSSIRAVERVTGIHRDTIMRLGVRMGEGCKEIQDKLLRNLPCNRVEVDEIWGFIGMKQRTAKHLGMTEYFGDIWSWIALDAETKLVPCFAVGDRSAYMAKCFIEDLKERCLYRIQLSSDGLAAYKDAVERAFGSEVDYGHCVKTYTEEGVESSRRYSPPRVTDCKRTTIQGAPAH